MIWIEFFLYWVGSWLLVRTCTSLLTPRFSRMKTMVIWFLVMFPLGTVKFFMGPEKGGGTALVVGVNMFLFLAATKVLFFDGLKKCIMILIICVMIMNGAAMIHVFFADYIFQRDSLSVMLGYAVQLPLIAGAFEGLIRRQKRQKNGLLSSNMDWIYTLGLFSCALYIIFLGYLMIDFQREMNVFLPWAWTVNGVGTMLLLLLVYVGSRKVEERRKLARLARLSYERRREQKNYEETCRRVEQMAKLRHDFYEQLATAKYILSVDVSEGMELLSEMEQKMESVKK